MDWMPVGYLGEQYALPNWLVPYVLLSLAGLVFWVFMLVDAIRREFSDSTIKLIWVLVLVFTNFVGALIYFFVGRAMGRLRA